MKKNLYNDNNSKNWRRPTKGCRRDSYRGTQREILRKRPKDNNKAWLKFFETILSILGDCGKKIICSSLPARLKEEFPACNLTYWEVS